MKLQVRDSKCAILEMTCLWCLAEADLGVEKGGGMGNHGGKNSRVNDINDLLIMESRSKRGGHQHPVPWILHCLGCSFDLESNVGEKRVLNSDVSIKFFQCIMNISRC